MKSKLVFAIIILALICPLTACADEWMWAKGNLHTHSTNSDGDSDPQVVVDWYMEHGYDFLIISDHWHVTDYSDIDIGEGRIFPLIHGDETGVTKAPTPIHLNSMGVERQIPGAEFTNYTESIQTTINRIREAGGIPMVNHPNFRWSFGHRELLGVEGEYLLEIFNGAPGSNNHGNNAYLSVEQTWDILLSNGKTVYAAATDDAHHFKEFAANRANPGRGWVVVRTPELTYEAILDALDNGDFYASTGVVLEDYGFDGREISIKLKPEDGKTYTIRLVGIWGSIVKETVGISDSFDISELRSVPENAYLRWKVISSDGSVAWTQAFRLSDDS